MRSSMCDAEAATTRWASVTELWHTIGRPNICASQAGPRRCSTDLTADLIATLGGSEAIEVLGVLGEELGQTPVRAAAAEEIEDGADELALPIGDIDARRDVNARRRERGRGASHRRDTADVQA